MNTYKITYKTGKTIIVKAETSLEVVKRYDLASIVNIGSKITQLTMEGGE